MNPRRGVTLIEGAVVMAVGGLVLGLILTSLIETSRASNEILTTQQMRQEALLIGQEVEKVIRYRVDAEDVLVAQASTAADAGAARTSTTTGTATQSTVPKSLEGTLLTTPTLTPAPGAARTPTAAELTSVPATLKPLLAGTTETAALRPRPEGKESYAPNELLIYSLGEGKQGEKPLAAIRNSQGVAGEARHTFIERLPVQGGVEGDAIALGSNADKLQSSVSFRYASDFDGLNARWSEETAEVPRLIEYTVRVWSKTAGPKYTPRDAGGRPAGFEYTSAVEVR